MTEQILNLIFGAIAGGLIAFAIQFYYSQRIQDIAYLNDFILDLKIIEETSIKYWLIEEGQNLKEQEELAIQLRGRLHANSTFASVAQELLSDKFEKFQDLDDQLFDSTTGGTFESIQKTRDPHRIVTIMQLSNEMRGIIRQARRRTYF